MTDPISLPSAAVLRPLAKSVGRHLSRWKREHDVARGAEVPDLPRQSLLATLDRLRGGQLDDSWWRRLLSNVGQIYVAPDWLKQEPVRQWLAEQSVADYLLDQAERTLAGAASGADDTARHQAEAGYVASTGESLAEAGEAVDAIVAVLISGFLASISKDQQPLAALILATRHRLPTEPDPVARKVHSGIAQRELEKLRARSALPFLEPHREALNLLARVTNGDLSAADAESRSSIQYWAALYCADQTGALNTAKELRRPLGTDGAGTLAVLDARIAEADGDPDSALRRLRDLDSAFARSALFATQARVHGERRALEWFDEQDVGNPREFFTSRGWRNWAVAMAKKGRWTEAAARLAAVETPQQSDPDLALIEGAVNAAFLLPRDFRYLVLENVPLYRGIELHHTPAAAGHHARATACFDNLRDQLAEIQHPEFTRYLDCWQIWLRLMNPNAGAAQEARTEVAQEMTTGSRGILLAPVVWAFDLEFDPGPLSAWLDSRRELGGLNADEQLAELILKHRSNSPAKFLAYIARNRPRLEAVTQPSMLNRLELDACVKTGEKERATLLVEKMGETLGEGPREFLLSQLEPSASRDPRTALETAYREKKSLVNLQALVAHLQATSDFQSLRQLSLEMFERESTPENANLVVFASEQLGAGSSLEFLDSIPKVVAVSDKLQADHAEALFFHGRLEEAKFLTDVLLDKRESWRDTTLELLLALHTGEWERVTAIVDREWERRDRRDARSLLQLAGIAAESGLPTARALDFCRLAMERGADDPHILSGAYLLHLRLDQEDAADPAWLEKAKARSSDTGPVLSGSLDAFVQDVLPRRREAAKESARHVAAGRLSISVVADQFNVSMLSLIVQQAKWNQKTRDSRRLVPIPIVSGSREPISIKRDWTVGMDITSILVLNYLGLLEDTLNGIGRIALSPDIFVALFTERRTTRLHQPSQLRYAKELRSACDDGHILHADATTAPNSEILSEVGPQLASLLSEAEMSGGTVVCDRPIYHFGSLSGQEATVGARQKLLLSPLEFCEALAQAGQLGHGEIEKARQLLPKRPWRPETERVSLSCGPVYLDSVALHYLQDARLLPTVATSGVDLRIHQDVLAEARILIQNGENAEHLVAGVSSIRTALRAAISKGTAFLLPRTQPTCASASSEVSARESTQSLLQATAGYDAVCIDDRAQNRVGGLADATGRIVPVLSILDILRELRRRSVLTSESYLAALHTLRASGFVFVLPDEEELYSRWRAQAGHSGISESAELATIRRIIARVCTAELCTPPEAVAISRGTVETGAKSIRRLWMDSEVSVERANILSNRMWRHILETPWVWLAGNPSSAAHGRRERLALSLAFLLAPLVGLPDDRRIAYSRWIRQIVAEIAPAKPRVIEEAVANTWAIVQSIEKYTEFAGYVFLAQMPANLRNLAVAENSDFARKCGFDWRDALSIPGGPNMNLMALMSASRTSFQTGRAIHVLDRVGGKVEIVPRRQRAGVEVQWVDGKGTQNVVLEDLALVANTDRTRTKAMRRLADRVGPTAPMIHELLEERNNRPFTDDEVAGALREAAVGFARIRAKCRSAIQRTQKIRLSDILPASATYFEELAGPGPGTESTDEYVRNTLTRYRKTLLRRHLGKGLELALRGCLRDDLCPGQWLTRYGDDRIWEALEATTGSRNPFVLIGALDICLYRQKDDRFKELAESTVERLAGPQLENAGVSKQYVILHALSGLVQNQVALLLGFGSRPNHWRRMCGLMHAGWLLDLLDVDQMETDNFLEWIASGRHLAGHYADAVGARQEPMLNAAMMTPGSIRDEVVGRLDLLRVRHEKAGRRVAWSDSMEAAWRRVRGAFRSQIFAVPGPLEGHRRPSREIPEGFVDAAHRKFTEHPEVSRLRVLAVLSQGAKPSSPELENARKIVELIPKQADKAHSLEAVEELNFASVIAVACRDQALGDAVADALVQMSRLTAEEEIVHQAVRLLVQTAAVHEDEPSWSAWLDRRLVAVANSLPGPPSEMLAVFLDSIRAMEAILASEAWFHLRGRAVALSGAA